MRSIVQFAHRLRTLTARGRSARPRSHDRFAGHGSSICDRLPLRVLREQRGAATAEYAIATMAAVGFAGLLVVIMRSDEVRAILTDLVRNALTFAG